MPINEIRETIQEVIPIGGSGVGYMTRRINLKHGQRNQILSVDVFNDNLLNLYDGLNPVANGYQLFISPFPMQLTNNTWGPDALVTSGAMAGDEQVLYKELMLTKNGVVNTPNNAFVDQFPSKEVGATPTTNWYSPHLYVTFIWWGMAETSVKVDFSVFLRVKQTNTSATVSSMGAYKEFLDSQCRLLSTTATVYDPANVAGNTFPMWKYGGIRSEVMISGATALRYFNRVAANANQTMTSQAALETAYQAATTMVAFDAPFGDVNLNLPEWITLMDVSGVTSGLIRPFAPPLKFADNGNTEMF